CARGGIYYDYDGWFAYW
nr:immunoglobulin heavy chain junction region [Mus musculus]NSM07476.1 immunoglobulin heavy chain junction region [Mus musculus]NSM08317.1 immunoglobulin heavy chain junction region [Mus musculus]